MKLSLLVLTVLTTLLSRCNQQQTTTVSSQNAKTDTLNYEELSTKALQHGKMLIEHLSDSNVMKYFEIALFDTNGIGNFLNTLSIDCNLKKSIYGYAGKFIVDHPKGGKMFHTLYEIQSDCGDFYMQISYLLKDNDFAIFYFYKESIDSKKDMIMNMLNNADD